MKLPTLVSVREASKALRVGDKKVYNLVHAGELVGHDIAGVVRIDQQSVADYLERQRIITPAHVTERSVRDVCKVRGSAV